MSRLTDDEREVIAYNISEQRKKRYPGHGGGKKCAEAFGVPTQQWSPWECGSRTPDNNRLAQIAKFFKVPVDSLRKEPANWAEIKPRWLAGKRKSKRRTATLMVERDDGVALVSRSLGGMGEMVGILKSLVKGQNKVEEGLMDADEFAKKLEQIHNFVRFTLGE